MEVKEKKGQRLKLPNIKRKNQIYIWSYLLNPNENQKCIPPIQANHPPTKTTQITNQIFRL